MNAATATTPCPKCQLPTKRHCANSFSCNWLKCFTCRITIGPRRAVDANGKTVP